MNRIAQRPRRHRPNHTLRLFLSALVFGGIVGASLALACDVNAQAPAPSAAPADAKPKAKPAAAEKASDGDKKPAADPKPPAAKPADKAKPAPENKAEPAAKPQPKPVADDDESGLAQIELFTQVLEMVRQDYVDSEKTTYERLINSALEGMLADLDPHSQFMHPRVFEQLKQNTGSTYEGVGITISYRNEVLSIVTVREDGPAARAGVLPGDQILKINNSLTEKLSLSEAIGLLKGKPGQKLKLTLRRPATSDLIEVEMVREIIREDTVNDVGLLAADQTEPYKIGYARLLQFSEPTAEELANALDQLEAKGMQAFILDLRNNPGGLLGSAVDVAGEFLPANTLVLTTEGRPGSGMVKPYHTSETRPRERTYPVAILVNNSSASGSEVVAGALQDLKRAIIVGETTFGKGSVQSVKALQGGRAIRMTTAKYYTPSKRTIHENGVIPNIIATLTPDEEEQMMGHWHRDRLSPEERKKLGDFDDRQLARAIDAMKGALIFSSMQKPATPEKPAVAAPAPPEPKPAAAPGPPKPDPKPAARPSPEQAPAEPKAPGKPAPQPQPAPAADPS